jgi:hypothetical protein
MTLFRMIVVLVAGLLVMLCVVILRAETARLHYEISQRERQAEVFRQQLHDAELELARLRNPMLMRRQVKEAVDKYLEETAPPPPPSPARRGRS